MRKAAARPPAGSPATRKGPSRWPETRARSSRRPGRAGTPRPPPRPFPKLFWGGALIAAAGVTIVTASGLGYNAWADLASETGWDFLQDQLIWGIAYCGLAALSFAVIAVARREHPTMVTLTLLTIACVIPFLVLFAGTIGIFIVVLYFIFSLFRR